MADDWQLEAIHEQFRGKREVSPQLFNFSDSKSIAALLNTVGNAISKHLRAPLKLKARSTDREIASQIIKAASDRSNLSFKYSFIVIIANKEVNDRLWKLPIFVVEVANTCLFIDLKCSVYKSWEAFLQSNDLPPCDFCYPVDGKYSDHLKIDYAKSPASAALVQTFFTVGHKVISAACVAGTFFFKIARCALECAKILAPIASRLIPVLGKSARIIVQAGMLIQQFKCGKIGIIQLTQGVFKLLECFNSMLAMEVFELWIEIKKRLGSAYDYLNEQFGCSTSGELQGTQISHQDMATTYKTDSEFKDIKKKADIMVQASVKRNDTINLLEGERKGNNSTTPASQSHYSQKILADSKTDYENYSCMNKTNFSQETCDLVKITADIVKHIQGTQSESTYTDTFEALADTLKNSYGQKINTYLNTVKAAEQGAGHKIDLEAFNAALGIKGDYKEHFWNETFLSELKNHGPKLGEQIRIKIKHLKSKQQIMIHPITQQDNTVNHEGIFLWKSHKDICCKDVVSALQENIGLSVKEEDLVINQTECNIMIRNQHYIIFVYQSDKRLEGLIMIQKFA